MEKLFDKLICEQKKKLFVYAQRIIPHLTDDDLLQPSDFVQLELNPHFRYEEGILEGLMTAKMAYISAIPKRASH